MYVSKYGKKRRYPAEEIDYSGSKRPKGSIIYAKAEPVQREYVVRQKMFNPSAGLNRRGVFNKESGYVDLASATYALNTTGSIVLLATIAQGASVNQRIGKKVMLKSIQFRGFATADSTTTVAVGAFMIVYDKRPTGSVPAITDVLDSVAFQSFNNDANSGRFRILCRKELAFNGNNTTAGQQTTNSEYPASLYQKINRPCVFKAAGTGAIGDIEEGALYLITVGNIAAGTADANLIGGFRTRFVDV